MTSPTARCIVHVDMDCFYAQVECVRLGHDCRTVPYALIQWGNFIAVNYPARALGVRRFHDTPGDIRQRCPQVHMSHIATLAPDDTAPVYPENPLIQTHKVSLKPYRDASRKIFHILRHSEPGVRVGKAGIDEAYLDVTEAATLELARLQSEGRVLDALTDVLDAETRLIADRTTEMEGFFAAHGTTLERAYDAPMRALKHGDVWPEGEGSRCYSVRGAPSAAERAEEEANCLLLCAASRVVARLRARIYADLHYDCSAGIAHNRLLAKCISAAHKPRQQTLLLPDRSASALFDLPLDKVRGFGGKLGDTVREICGDGASLCRDVWLAPISVFAALSGDVEDNEDGEAAPMTSTRQCGAPVTSAGASVYFRLRGFSGDSVSDPALPSGVEAGKVFHPACTSLRATYLWMNAIASDLADRYSDYATALSPRGRLLTVRLTPYPRRAVLKSRPRLLPESEPLLSTATLLEHATLALKELLTSLNIRLDTDGEANASPDNALPLHQIYVSISALHAVRADPLRHTPTLLSLFSSSASARQTQTTTTESFFAAPRAKRPRVDVETDSEDDVDVDVDVEATEPHPTTDGTGTRGTSTERRKAAAVRARTATLDAFCRPSDWLLPAAGRAAPRDADPIVHSLDSGDLVHSSPSSSVESMSPSPADGLPQEPLVEVTEPVHTPTPSAAVGGTGEVFVIDDDSE